MPDNELNPVVGIDLGTTFSCIARWAGDRAEVYRLADGADTIPSIVHIQDGGKPLVGKFARQRLTIEPEHSVEKIKRHIGEDGHLVTMRGQQYSPVDVSAMILERLKHDVQRMYPESAGFEMAGAVITHPHYFKYPQIARTQQAAEQAGLPILRLLSEPVAAALDYGFATYRGLEEERSETLLVFDLGGGTFDVTVIEVANSLNELSFKVRAVGGDDMLGGTNFDEELANWALMKEGIEFSEVDEKTKARAQAKLYEAAIESKIQLSSMEETSLLVPNILPGQHLDLEVSRGQFEEVIDSYCKRIRGIVSSTVAAAGLREGDLDKTILVGGSSYIPIMRKIVEEETGAEPWANADPNLAVARGAAFLGALEDGRVEGLKKEIVVEEATSHALGVRAAGDAFSVIIPANRRAPVKGTKVYEVDGPNFTVQPYQGKARKGGKVTDEGVMALKPIEISGVKLGPDGLADLSVTFTVTDQQILRVLIEAPGIQEEHQMEF